MARIGLVLSGGMAKGAYQIGVLQALQQYLSPDDILYTSASSIGVLNAYAFLTGKLNYAKEMWQKCNPEQHGRLVIEMLQSSYLRDAIDNVCDPMDVLPNPCYASLYNASQNSLSYVDLSAVDPDQRHSYLYAAVSLPPFNCAVELLGDRFYDGAMIDNIPVFPLVEKDLDYILCIYFDHNIICFETPEFDRKIIKIVLSDDSFLSTSVVFSNDRIDNMIAKGYNASLAVFQDIFSLGVDNIPHILSANRKRNLSSQKIKMRITGDMVVTNLNRVAKRITRRRGISQ